MPGRTDGEQARAGWGTIPAMPALRPRTTAAALTLLLAAAGTACGPGPHRDSAGPSGATSTSPAPLVVETTFRLRTLDPARTSEPTGLMIEHALYDTLLTYSGTGTPTPAADLASSYTASTDARTFTFTLDPRARFADGTPVTAADVVFSLTRVANVHGTPSFLMAGITATAVGAGTVVLTSAEPNAAIPAIVTNPALSIVEATAVERDGGTDAADAVTTDKAEGLLDYAAAGSGPYRIVSWSTTSEVVIAANPDYWRGHQTPGTIAVRNGPPSEQAAGLRTGRVQVALDLTAAQAGRVPGIRVDRGTSATVFFLLLNESPAVSKLTPNPLFRTAVRDAVDYDGLLRIAGPGAVRAAGIIPSVFAGSLPASAAVATSRVRARAALRAAGLVDPKVTLSFPSDLVVNGVPVAALASRVGVSLGQVGIRATLTDTPLPTALADYVAGRDEIGLWAWTPDFADPADYLTFLPGALVGRRADWPAGADPVLAGLAARAAATTDPAVRAGLFTRIQQRLDVAGPVVPLIQPAQVVATRPGVPVLTPNPLWMVDLPALR